MDNGSPATLSIITATHNAAKALPQLISSLEKQTDKDFEWIVADGASTDETLQLIATLQASSSEFHIQLDSRPDFGIYDALNRGVAMASGEYYLVMGADDQLAPDAVQRYKEACSKSNADFVTAKVQFGRNVHGVRNCRMEWINRQFAHVSSHAVGTAIRTNLHARVGWYSRMLPIAADQLFILRAIHTGSKVSEQSFCAGTFGMAGVSAADKLGTLVESFRVQVMVGHNLALELLLLNFRIFKIFVIDRWRRKPGGTTEEDSHK